MSVQSAVSPASSESNALRATIPQAIVLYLKLEAGDRLEWKMENSSDGTRIATVSKAKR